MGGACVCVCTDNGWMSGGRRWVWLHGACSLQGRDVFQSIVSKQVKISSVVAPPAKPQPTKVRS